MSEELEFFEGIGGEYVPTAFLKGIGDVAYGEVVDVRTRDHIPFGKQEPDKNKDGSTRRELVVTIQTKDRNWANVVKVPKSDPDDPNSPDKPASEDDGKRNIYVPQHSNIQYAIGRAIKAQKAKALVVGGQLAVKISNLKDTGKGNPLKEHEAKYTPPADDDPFITEEPKKAEEPKKDDPWATPDSSEEAPF